jgi:hypothetical protein
LFEVVAVAIVALDEVGAEFVVQAKVAAFVEQI